eukprot:m.71192 g.71192  ORF g.71192 m.71192 type:complete len:129 (+) comp35736_c0_seq6:888-1274(+)
MESDLTDKEWKKSKAIISTIEAARKRSLGAQLFLAIFNNPREGHNVYQIAANNGYIPRKRQGFIAAQRVVDASLGYCLLGSRVGIRVQIAPRLPDENSLILLWLGRFVTETGVQIRPFLLYQVCIVIL